MIKHIDPKKKLSKKLVYKRSFPGKTGDQICSIIDDIYADVEPSRVIIHAGTNNLQSRSVHSCVFNMEYLALKTRGKFQNAKIAISGLTQTRRHRCVREAIGGQHQVERNDNEKRLDFMDNSHILDGTCLNGKKLDLNSK